MGYGGVSDCEELVGFTLYGMMRVSEKETNSPADTEKLSKTVAKPKINLYMIPPCFLVFFQNK